MPCRGTGKVVSNLGGSPSEVTCPWCEGGGVRIAGIDAQAKWREGEDAGEAGVTAAREADDGDAAEGAEG
jgi:hypothetical protein